jgi:hypothetical protein
MSLRRALLCAAGLLLAACTSGQTGAIPAPAVPNLARQAKLQLAVGTATLGVAAGGSLVGLNVVATFRGPNGNNATGLNTPTLQGPPGLDFGLGTGNVITGTLPSQLAAYARAPKGATPPPGLQNGNSTGFGPYVGVFGYGLAGDNPVPPQIAQALTQVSSCLGIWAVGNTVPGGQYNPSGSLRSNELAQPVPSGYVTSGGIALTNPCTAPPLATYPASLNDPAFPYFFQPPGQGLDGFYGGPPAWPASEGYGNYAFFLGYPLGFVTFSARPVAGTYTLSVAYPTSENYGTYGTLTAQATLSQTGGLPATAPPTLTVNADGSGTIQFSVPAGVGEAVVEVQTNDCDFIESAQRHPINPYSFVTHQPGTQTIYVPNNLGPPDSTGRATHTFCTAGDLQAYNAYATATGTPPLTSFTGTVTVIVVGADYPLYESSYPFTMSPTPRIANAIGQADVTISYPLIATYTVNASGAAIRR